MIHLSKKKQKKKIKKNYFFIFYESVFFKYKTLKSMQKKNKFWAFEKNSRKTKFSWKKTEKGWGYFLEFSTNCSITPPGMQEYQKYWKNCVRLAESYRKSKK